MHEVIINYLLPVLLSKVVNDQSISINSNQLQAQARESRFLSLKIMTDILVYFLGED